MCDFGVSETVAGVSAGIAASTAAETAAASAAATAAATTSVTSAATALGVGSIAEAAGVTGATSAASAALTADLGMAASALGVSTVAEAASGAGGAAAAGGMGAAEYGGIASLVLSLAGGGASGGTAAKQAKEQNTLINAQAKEAARGARTEANQQAEANAQSSFNVAVAALGARGNAQSANLGDRSVRAISRAVGFQEGTDKATIIRNQEIANGVASAKLRGINITQASQHLQVGNPATIAGTSAVSSLANALYTGGAAYSAFSKFKIPTDGPNLAFT